MPELVIGGVLLIPIIVALVELAKKIGMPGEYAPWLNAVLSVVAYGAVVLLGEYPEYANVAGWVINALVIFLSGAGFYSTVKFGVKRVKALSL